MGKVIYNEEIEEVKLKAKLPLISEISDFSKTVIPRGNRADTIIETSGFCIVIKDGCLNLSHKKLGPEAMHPVMSVLELETEIINLDVSYNFIRDKGLQYITALLLSSNESLLFLNLNNNGINLADSKYRKKFMLGLETHKQLCSLQIAGNPIGDRGVINLAEVLKSKKSTLIALDIEKTGMTEQGIIAVSDALKSKDCKLIVLNIANNIIKPKGLKILGDAVSKNRTLNDLNISNIGVMDPEDILAFLKIVQKSNIKNLYINSEERITLDKKRSKLVLAFVKAKPALVELCIENLDLDPSVVIQIAETVQSYNSLEKLKITSSSIRDEDRDRFFSILSAHTSITDLYLNSDSLGLNTTNESNTNVDIDELKKMADKIGFVLKFPDIDTVEIKFGKEIDPSVVDNLLNKFGIVARKKLVMSGINLDNYINKLLSIIDYIESIEFIDISGCTISKENIQILMTKAFERDAKNNDTELNIILSSELCEDVSKIYNDLTIKKYTNDILHQIKEQNDARNILKILQAIDKEHESKIASIIEALKEDNSITEIEFDFPQNTDLAQLWIEHLAPLLQDNKEITKICFAGAEIIRGNNKIACIVVCEALQKNKQLVNEFNAKIIDLVRRNNGTYSSNTECDLDKECIADVTTMILFKETLAEECREQALVIREILSSNTKTVESGKVRNIGVCVKQATSLLTELNKEIRAIGEGRSF